ncbi:hypothetical protein KY385_03565 [Candidatus Parcubacteria bacterium]|nr:hypothetical protein [Candidatus Parcubacteria bacterium]
MVQSPGPEQLERIGIFGCGSVGSFLVMQLAAQAIANQVVVSSNRKTSAEAAVSDVAGAYPEIASTFKVDEELTGDFDVVVISAGKQPDEQTSRSELLKTNLEIAFNGIKSVGDCRNLVVIGTPVDELNQELSRLDHFSGSQVIGFGGQLDVNRARYALLKRGLKIPEPLYVVGEHGKRAIPVYRGEMCYEEVRSEINGHLDKQARHGIINNFASGIELARLLRALAGDEQVLCVSASDESFDGLSITWPRIINRHGLSDKIEIPHMGPNASSHLQDLLDVRRKEANS